MNCTEFDMRESFKVGQWVVVINDIGRVPMLIVKIDRMGYPGKEWDRVWYYSFCSGGVDRIYSAALRLAIPEEILPVVEQDGKAIRL